uniref:Cytochrome c3 n=1 Tax=Candidatus Kentrum sp. FM TaxID=2126340 RepID=A0A450TFN7_9GAMM|nr:MAG: Cytochrome c3 [Candidatus Kentron sp. FM]VFJ66145.1 MAG: Cytochrome c3 [Candidatus Kentron sp. FM]VFK15998.1 MAG: Cytochrome c3 [Candidatus Kentron sp. FM]
MTPSPYAHIYRLGGLGIIALVVFFIVKYLAIPASWDKNTWYRQDALSLLQQQEPVFGTNQSCEGSSCHEDENYLVEDARIEHRLRIRWLGWATHKTLSCESCHGPLSDHVQDGFKVRKAVVVRTGELCLRCHESRLGRNAVVAFREDFEYHKSLSVTKRSSCVKCHDPHEPK